MNPSALLLATVLLGPKCDCVELPGEPPANHLIFQSDSHAYLALGGDSFEDWYVGNVMWRCTFNNCAWL